MADGTRHTHSTRFSADSARFLSSSASVAAAATVTNDVVVFIVVDVGCWLSIRMLVVGFVACSDLCGLLVVVVAMVVS